VRSLRWLALTCVFVGCGGAAIAEPDARTTPTATPTPNAPSPAAPLRDAELGASDAGADAVAVVEVDAQPGEAREVSARHILVRVGAFPNGKKRTLRQAQSLIAVVQRRFAAGEDFAALSKEYSEDPGTARRGGDLGSFRRGQMVKEFEDAVFALAPYEATVVETAFGVHLVQRTR